METSPTKTIINAFMAIDAHCEAIGADSIISNLAKCFFQEIVSYRGHEEESIQALVTICVVYACKQVEFTQTAEHILSFTDIPADYLICAMRAVDVSLVCRQKKTEERERERTGLRRRVSDGASINDSPWKRSPGIEGNFMRIKQQVIRVNGKPYRTYRGLEKSIQDPSQPRLVIFMRTYANTSTEIPKNPKPGKL